MDHSDTLFVILIAWPLVLLTIMLIPPLLWCGLFLLAFAREGFDGAATFWRMTWERH